MDSMAHVVYCDTIRDIFIKCSIDSLRMFSVYNYEIMDYNPFLFFCYITSVSFLNNHDSLYNSWPVCFYYGLEQGMQDSRIPEYTRQFGLILTSTYIFKIKIDSTVIGMDSTFHPPAEVINASATITEIIKGKKTPCNCKISNGAGRNNYLNDSLNTKCFNFSYPTDLYTAVGWGPYPFPTSRPISLVEKGEEYFIFLSEGAMDEWEEQISVEFRYEATGGLFRIVNNRVEDLENFFGLGYTPSDSEFRKMLLLKIDTLKSWINLPKIIVQENNSGFQNLSNDISIFPNPLYSASELMIQIPHEITGMKINLYNSLGSLLDTHIESDISPGTRTITYDLNRRFNDIQGLPSGTYWLRVEAGKDSWCKAFVVVR